MNRAEYEKLVKFCDEREKAWRPPSRTSMIPAMFSRPAYTAQALLVFTGFVCVMAWEGIKTAFEWVMG